MLEVADTWSIRLPFTRDAFQFAGPDNPIVIEINGSPVLTGLIDDSEKIITRDSGSYLQLAGRDRGGRLVDESAPLFTFSGLGIKQLAEKLVLQWFPEVVLQNTTNRRLTSGKSARQAKVSSEPPIGTGGSDKHKVSPGETRSQVLEFFLERGGLTAWSSADGRQFVVGKPNYSQEPQFQLIAPRLGSRRPPGRDVIEVRHKESTGDRYARITVMGAAAGDDTNFGANVRRRATARQGPNPDGTGGSFRIPKELILLDQDLPTAKSAQERVDREMALRESKALELSVVVEGHSQPMSDGTPANWSIDKMVRFVDEEIEARGNPTEFLVTKVEFSADRGSGQRTALTLVPKGTDLRSMAG